MNLNSNILHLQTEHLEMDRDVLLLVVQFIGTLKFGMKSIYIVRT